MNYFPAILLPGRDSVELSAMSYQFAVHSDFLVHWTGKDLDKDYDPEWHKSDKSKTDGNDPLNQAYLKRLHDILKYGLWLTEEDQFLPPVGEGRIDIPSIPKTCFTELKLSQSRTHAERYGRLGIGVKRPYLFSRFGRPLAYYGFRTTSSNDPFLSACTRELQDKRLLSFFKPMNSGTPLNYDLYSESEWRILHFQQLLDKQLLIDPRDKRNADAHEYFNSLTAAEQEKLKYLAPLDGWFQLIIYPSLRIKNMAQQNESARIRGEISRIKALKDHGNRVEHGNWPMEIDLDACRHF